MRPRAPTGSAGSRRKLDHPVRWWVEYAGAALAVGAVRGLPERLALAAGAGIGSTFARIDSHYRRLAIANLALVFPDASPDRRRGMLRRNFAEMGRSAAEWARTTSLSDAAVLDRIDVRGGEHLRAALERRRGALVVSAHYGYWEMNLRAAALHLPDLEIAAVQRTQPNPHLARLVGLRRRLGGVGLLDQNALAIRRALGRNVAVAVLADHYLSQRKGGVLAPFLGWPAWSNPGPAVLALSARCPVLISHIHRVGGSRHCVEIAPVEVPGSGPRATRIIELTTRINDAIGQLIRRDPELWLWSNHRWRASPEVSERWYPSRRRSRQSPRASAVSPRSL